MKPSTSASNRAGTAQRTRAPSAASARSTAAASAAAAMGATSEPSPNLPATHAPAAGLARSDRLESETKQMEARLAALRVAMDGEKAKRAQLPRTRAGGFWKGADPLAGGAKYMEEVMARVERRVARAQAITATGGMARPATQQQQQSNAGTASLAATQQRINSAAAKPSASSSTAARPPSTSSAASSAAAAAAAAAARSAYVPPVAPKAGTATAAKPATAAVSSARAARPASAAANGSINPADDADPSSAAPGSLLAGEFDESANKAEFAAARAEWLAASSNTAAAAPSSTSSAGTSTRTQLVHDPDYTPAVAASPEPAGVGAGSLLDGPAFDERASRREFEEARRAWMHSIDADATAGKQQAKPPSSARAQQASASAGDGQWIPSVAQGGSGSSILFSSEPASARGVNAALRESQSGVEKSAKHSCYQCYRLFYSDAGAKLDDDATDNLPPVLRGKHFCSRACVDAAVESSRVRCDADGCVRLVKWSRARSVEGRAGQRFCDECAENGGVHRAPEPEPLPELPTAQHADDEPLSPANEAHEQQQESEQREEAGSQQPLSARVSRPSTAAASRPATAARPRTALTVPPEEVRLDTSVIRQASPTAPAAAPVVEFPSDDDDDV